MPIDKGRPRDLGLGFTVKLLILMAGSAGVEERLQVCNHSEGTLNSRFLVQHQTSCETQQLYASFPHEHILGHSSNKQGFGKLTRPMDAQVVNPSSSRVGLAVHVVSLPLPDTVTVKKVLLFPHTTSGPGRYFMGLHRVRSSSE